MAENELRIGIVGAGASDFASTPVASLTVTKTQRPGPPARSYIRYARPVDEPSINGVDTFTGPSVGPKFLWTVSCLLTVTEARQLTRLFGYQNNRVSGIDEPKNTPNLRLIDETRYINDYERQQHGRTLLAELNEADNAAQKYGYGVFNVALLLDDDFLEAFGTLSGSKTDNATFQIREI
ncbi:MAG: hypothetical protein AAF810_04955 [Cyanobacteria bacterium P01_D01_bin.36]